MNFCEVVKMVVEMIGVVCTVVTTIICILEFRSKRASAKMHSISALSAEHIVTIVNVSLAPDRNNANTGNDCKRGGKENDAKA